MELALRCLVGDRTVPVGDERSFLELLDEFDRRDDAEPVRGWPTRADPPLRPA